MSTLLRIKDYTVERFVPLAFAAGIALGFFLCRGWGEVAARTNPFPEFVRFYQALAPSSGYFPTVNQLVVCNATRCIDHSER